MVGTTKDEPGRKTKWVRTAKYNFPQLKGRYPITVAILLEHLFQYETKLSGSN